MRKLLITLVVLVVVLVAADFGLRAFAESRTAAAVQSELGTAVAPDVSIEGFPFLLHAVRGEYPQVVVTADDIDTGRLPGTRVVLDLFQVSLPLSDALAGDTSRLQAQSTALRVLIPLSSLTAALNQPNVTFSEGPDGSLLVSSSVTVLGQQIPVTGAATIGVADGALTLSVGKLTAGGVDLTSVIAGAVNALAGSLSTSIPLPALPFSITQATATVSGGDVVLTVTTGPIMLNDIR